MRREHYDNEKSLLNIKEELYDIKKTLEEISSKQNLNDIGMATLFKLN